ncbi:MAG TPA: efflux transporter outer membrane subunit [Alphaproteobacteria bacterium]|nr:efflux transporter outer membrane subunit [Alphaproteobacteria bacterium]
MALAAGCAVGPDFEPPAAPNEAGYTPEKLAAKTNGTPGNLPGGAVQHFGEGQDIPAQWWSLYRSESLNKLIEAGLRASPTLEAAKAALRQAQENTSAARGAFFPDLTGNVSASRQKAFTPSFGGGSGIKSIYSLSSASVDLSYPLDVFGGIRRQVEATEAAEDYQRFQLVAAYLTLTSNIVTTAVEEASLRAQIKAQSEIIDIETNQVQVLRNQLSLGGVAGGAVLAQEAILGQARATLPPLEKQLAQSRNRLAVLVGKFPSEDIGATFDLAQLALPTELPVSLPAKLVEQRPDIQAASAKMHQASAQVGVATANELPQISLTGSIGNTASPAGNLFSPGVGIWSIGGNLAQKLFDGGTLYFQRRAAVAAYDQAAAQYRATALSAFEDVANALRALQADADALAANLAADQAAQKSLALSQEQYRLGAINYATLLNAEQTAQQARISLVQSQAARFSDTAALFQALGGGWWNAASGTFDPTKPDQ